jgi:methionyl-tRNA synthetase
MGVLTCMLCHSPMDWKMVDREFLRLDRYRDFLRGCYAARPLRAPLRRLLDEVLENDDLVWGITRPHEHGIPLPGAGGRIVHTWFSGMAGYYAAFEEYAERRGEPQLLDRFWRSRDTRIVHFLGFDCSYSHALAYRALLSDFDDAPAQVLLHTNAFLKLNGGDFSTSRGHAIWVRDVLEDTPADCLRLYLAALAPEQAPTNFDLRHFRAWRRDEFDLSVGRLVQAGGQEVERRGLVDLDVADGERLRSVRARWLEAAAPETFSLATLARLLGELRAHIGGRLDRHAGPVAGWLAVYAVAGRALHPSLSASILAALGVDEAPVLAWLKGEAPAPQLCAAGEPAAPPRQSVAVG